MKYIKQDIKEPEEKRISITTQFFSIYIAFMLFQTERFGSIFAFVSLMLVILSCFFTGRVSFTSFILPATSQFVLVFFLIVSCTTLMRGINPPNFGKITAQVLLYIILSTIDINSRENEFLKKVFISANVLYAILAIRYCLLAGETRYYHSDIVILGATFDPNFIGISFVVALSLLLDKFLNGSYKILCAFLYFLIAVAVVFTASHSNMIAWVISSVLVVAQNNRNNNSSNLKRWFWMLSAIALLSVLVAFFSNRLGLQWMRMVSISSEGDNGRLKLWRDSLALWKQFPVFGGGLRNFYNTFRRGSHNTYLQILTDSGIIGAGLMYSFFASLLVKSWRADKTLFAALCGMYIQMLFIDTIDNRVVWIVFCWVAMLAYDKGDNNAEENNQIGHNV